MRNRLLICVAAMLLAGGSFAFAQGVSQGTTDQKSAAPKAGDAKQAQTPSQDKAKASSASQPRDAKGRFTKKSDQSGSSAAAPSAKSTATTGSQATDQKSAAPKAQTPAQDKAKASSVGQARDAKGRFTKSGSGAAAPNAKSTATTGLGSSQGDQQKSAGSGTNGKASGAATKQKTTKNWLSKAMKAGKGVTGRPAPASTH